MPPRHGHNQLRIIGGTWRSRRVSFPDVEGLRPSPDRVRETLFNWLAPIIAGSRCLDLYAGSGALGLEALSRGAAAVTFVDTDRRVVQQLEQNLKLLGARGASVVQGDALNFLQRAPQAFDVVFLDPPFRRNLLPACLEQLAAGWLAEGARVYVESEAELGEPPLPPDWELLRSKQAGQVRYSLLQAP
ncbi:MAG: 16S rRNA (guanine(966)-N(2))-methyltransferase RsmD [Pseudomonadota bacterium]